MADNYHLTPLDETFYKSTPVLPVEYASLGSDLPSALQAQLESTYNALWTNLEFPEGWQPGDALPRDGTTFATAFTNFLQGSFNSNLNAPKDWESFMLRWYKEAGIYDPTQLASTPQRFSPLSPFFEGAVGGGDSDFTTFSNIFASVLGKDTTDWNDLGLTGTEKDNFFKGLFLRNFDGFLKQFPFGTYGDAVTIADFFNEWEKFLTITTANTAPLTNVGETLEKFPDLQRMFDGFFPNGDVAQGPVIQFADALKVFITKMTRDKGYFNPSQQQDDFIQFLVDVTRKGGTLPQTELVNGVEVVTTIPANPAVQTSKDEQERRNIIMVIFDLLGLILGSLQNTIAVQANRLKYLTDFQLAYTELMGRVPIYTGQAPKLVGPTNLWDDADLDDDLSNRLQGGAQGENVLPSGATWEEWLDTKGFAGITLREIRAQGVPMYEQLTGEGVIPLNGSYPGVFWFIEQPFGDQDDARWYVDGKEGLQEGRSVANQERQQWIEQMRTRRGIYKDEAKSAQTDLSGTKEAINQQSNFMSSIIQLVSGLLQSIFK